MAMVDSPPIASGSKPINKKKRVRKSCPIETKNITKFFGSRLYAYLIAALEKRQDAAQDLRLLRKVKCSTIKSLR
jgi:hypothetical protein